MKKYRAKITKLIAHIVKQLKIENDLIPLISNDSHKYIITQFESGFFDEIGWKNSFLTKKPVDKAGNPLPMMSYSMINFFKERLSKEMSIFEFGSGNSTLFFSKYVKKIITVEHDKKWYDYIKNNMPENVQIIYKELEYGGEYSKTAQKQNEKFDVILVDGRDRVNCAINSFEKLKESGVIIVDDMFREKYELLYSFFREKGFKDLTLSGISPGQLLEHKTTVFYRQNNDLRI